MKDKIREIIGKIGIHIELKGEYVSCRKI